MSFAEQVGGDVAPFLRWLVARGDWTVLELLDVLDDPGAWEPEFAEWQAETMPVPALAELEGEERTARR